MKTRLPLTLRLSVLGLLAALAPSPSFATHVACSQLAGAAGHSDGFCSQTPQSSEPPTGAASPAATAVLSGVYGAIGEGIGKSLVSPLPPMKPLPEVTPIDADDDLTVSTTEKTGAALALDIIGGYSGPLAGSELPTPRPDGLPAPASLSQVRATIAVLTPFLDFDRAAKDAEDPGYRKLKCPKGCGCSDRRTGRHYCTPTCSGTCYNYGGKDPRPAGTGLDCSGLIGQENPCFWYNNCHYTSRDIINAAEEHQVLRHPGPNGKDLDDIDRARDMRAGDVAFFNEPVPDGMGGTMLKTDGHVMQITQNPICNHDVCLVSVIHAPHTGTPSNERPSQSIETTA